jgi:hypothetical protein
VAPLSLTHFLIVGAGAAGLMTAAVAAFLIFVPPCKFKARSGNGAKKNLARLLHADGSRPWQLFDAARAEEHAGRVVPTWRRICQQVLHRHNGAVSR